jgi:hypothetical protein
MNDKLMCLVEAEKNSEFYPTPRALADKMVSHIKWKTVRTILEPSAGKGDLLKAVARKLSDERGIDVDCIEADANLRQVLSYNFSCEKRDEIYDRRRELDTRRWRDDKPLSEKEREELAALDDEYSGFFSDGIHIVGNDFLAYQPFKRYDLIIMNPPFSEGDKHLLKALDIQKRGGQIVCLLNAETIRNPYTHTRQELLKALEKFDYQCEFIQNAFCTAERATGVEVALIRVDIPAVQETSDIYDRMMKAEYCEEYENRECTELDITDVIKMLISKYRVECRSGLELIRQYKAMLPYIQNSFNDKYSSPLLELKVHSGHSQLSENDFLRRVRYKYWKALLCNDKFVGKLTSKLQSEYREKVQELSNYEFDEYNIMFLAAEMNSHIKSGIENEIEAMFDRMTEKHSYYPEFQKNIHYFNGWKTNKAYKVEKKVILPCYGVYDRYDGRPSVYSAHNVLCDVERIFNFLDGNMTAEIDLYNQLDMYFKAGITKNIHCKFFDVTFYKKGTVHITFTNPKLVERFNVYVTKRKGWLPPSYGEKAYKNMTEEEKAIVDSFQGEQAYNEVMTNANYYLAPVVSSNNFLALDTAEAS